MRQRRRSKISFNRKRWKGEGEKTGGARDGQEGGGVETEVGTGVVETVREEDREEEAKLTWIEMADEGTEVGETVEVVLGR